MSAPVKIDGKLNEWQDTLQAFNRTVFLGYTIANDEKNLYMAIKSSDQVNSNKILAGGITCSVNTEGKKKDKDAFIVTFPVVNTSPARQTAQRGPGGQRSAGQGQMQGLDANTVARRRQQLSQFREIKVSGFKEITDTLISIYNEYGIKVAADYDNEGSLIYELAVPLRLLNMTSDSKGEIAYNIKVNGRQFAMRGFNGGNVVTGSSGDFRGGGFSGARGGSGSSVSMFDAVDFWGKYFLADQ